MFAPQYKYDSVSGGDPDMEDRDSGTDTELTHLTAIDPNEHTDEAAPPRGGVIPPPFGNEFDELPQGSNESNDMPFYGQRASQARRERTRALAQQTRSRTYNSSRSVWVCSVLCLLSMAVVVTVVRKRANPSRTSQRHAARDAFACPRSLPDGSVLAMTFPSAAVTAAEHELLMENAQEICATLSLATTPFLSEHYAGGESSPQYLAGTDRDRLDDLETALFKRNVSLIFAHSKGWGASRLLPFMPGTGAGLAVTLTTSSDVLVGNGDFSSLAVSLYQRTKRISFYAPSLLSPWTVQLQQQALQLWKDPPSASVRFTNEHTNISAKVLKGGQAEGTLVGGAIDSILFLIMNSPDPAVTIKAFARHILFLDIGMGEEQPGPYPTPLACPTADALDRVLVQLSSTGVFRQISGLVIGHCSSPSANANDIEDVLRWHVTIGNQRNEQVPAFMGAALHDWILPIGVSVVMDAAAGVIETNGATVDCSDEVLTTPAA